MMDWVPLAVSIWCVLLGIRDVRRFLISKSKKRKHARQIEIHHSYTVLGIASKKCRNGSACVAVTRNSVATPAGKAEAPCGACWKCCDRCALEAANDPAALLAWEERKAFGTDADDEEEPDPEHVEEAVNNYQAQYPSSIYDIDFDAMGDEEFQKELDFFKTKIDNRINKIRNET